MMKDDREVDLWQLARVLRKNLKYIAAAMLIFGLLGLLGSTLLLTPIYEAKTKMIVITRTDKDEDLTNDQVTSAKSLVDTYAIVITSRDVLNQVNEELGLNMSYDSLKSSIQVLPMEKTQVMEVTVRHSNPDTALAIADKLLEIAPGVLMEVVEAGSVNPVEQAHVDRDPVSPNILMNTLVMALAGAVISCVVVVIGFFLDTTYKSELDIQNDLEFPVLGVIPTIESCKDQSGYGKRRSAKKSR